MFRKLLPIYVVTALVASAFLPSPIRAQSRVKMNAAWVHLVDAPTSCDYTITNVNVFETWRPRNGRAGMEHTTTLTFGSTNYDLCEELLTSHIEGSVEIPASAFRLQGLKSATLQVAVDFRDQVEGTLVPVIFDMAMTCIEGSEEGNPSGGYCVSTPSGSLLVRGRNLVDAPESDGQLTRQTGTVSQGLVSPAQAQGAGKSYRASAYFYDEPEGCEYFETYLDVYESQTRYERGRPEHKTTIFFQSLTYDTCEDVAVSVVQGFAEIPANSFRSQGLHSASLQLAMDFTDRAGGAIVPVTFDLTWSCQEKGRLYGGCGLVELSGNVLVGSRNLMDSEFLVGDLVSVKGR